MINISRFFLWLGLTFVVSNCQLLPFAGYQHDIEFPTFSGEFHTSTLSGQEPIRQLSAGFHLNTPPPLPFLQSFPINPQFFSYAKSAFKPDNFPSSKFFRAPLGPLFIPNTIRQKPESDAQDEEYRKYLKEEVEELEKEKEQNEITTDFTDFSFDTTSSLQPKQKSYVKLNVGGKDYIYST